MNYKTNIPAASITSKTSDVYNLLTTNGSSLKAKALLAFIWLSFQIVSAGNPLTGWLLLGPMPVPVESEDQAPPLPAQKAFFEANQVDPAQATAIKAGTGHPFGAARLTWNPSTPDAEGTVDLGSFYGETDFAAAYAYLEINSETARKAILGVGSDDAIRIWLNGALVHEYWGGRGLAADDDMVTISFQAGVNRLLVKVQDREYDWGFIIRELEGADFGERLVRKAGLGDLDAVRELLAMKADPNFVAESGLTAYQFAKMKSRSDMMTLLELAGANPNLPMPSPESLADRLLNKQVKATDAGIVVLASQNGKILYEKAFGMADIENGRALTTNSSFRIGSVTKQFTATAILMLVQDGKLSLEDKLSKFFPDVANASEITIRQMLNHTAGIRSYTEDEAFFNEMTVYVNPEKMEKAISGFKPDFDPGTQWYYTNSGYFLLGRIVEKASGKTLGQFWQDRIFKPLGMTRTMLYDNRQKIARPDEALGYSWEDGKFVRAPDWDMSWAAGAGAISSTVEDLFRWNEAVFSGKVLPSELMEQAFVPGLLNSGEVADAMGSTYGMGWMQGEYRGLDFIHHTGGLHGFTSYLGRIPDQQINLVALVNSLPGNGLDPSAAANAICEIFFYSLMEEQKSVEVQEIDLALLPDYVGRYAYPGGAILDVRNEDDRLLARLTGQQEMELFPETKDKFFWKVVDAKIEFIRNDQGVVTGAIHTQGGRTMEVGKMADIKEVQLDPAILDQYTGIYNLQGSDLKIERRGTRMYALIAGQPEIEIFASGEKEFFLKVVAATISFQTDASGRASSLKLNQAGVNMEADRKE